MKVAALLFLAATTAVAQQAPAGPKEVRLSVPKAKRSVAEHVQAILSRAPATTGEEPPLELDESVDPAREVEWGAEGTWWEVVLSFAKAASLELEDAGSQSVLLAPGPTTLFVLRADGEVLTGLKRVRGRDGEPLLRQVVILPPWYDTGGWTPTAMTVEQDPDAPELSEETKDTGFGLKLTSSVGKASFSWGIELYLRASRETLPWKAGAKFQVPGGGSVEITELATKKGRTNQDPNGDLAVVKWKATDLTVVQEKALLDDDTLVNFCDGGGYGGRSGGQVTWTMETVFDLRGKQAKEFRFKAVYEKSQITVARTFRKAELFSPEPKDLLSGRITWTTTPQRRVNVEVGAVRADGWGSRAAKMTLRRAEKSGELEASGPDAGTEGPVMLSKPQGDDLRYRIRGLDAGEWILWTRSGNWIDVRRVPVPATAASGDVVVALNHAASVTFHGTVEESWLVPADERGRPMGSVPALGVRLIVTGGVLKAEGLKPGDYRLTYGSEERGVKLVEGENAIELK